MSWPNPVSPGLFPQSPKFPESQLPKNTTITPLSAGFGSPNAMTPWTGKPRMSAAGNSSVVKECQMRRRQHKQKAKPSFHSDDQQDDELQPHQGSTIAFEPSSPVKATNNSRGVSSQQRKKVPAFLSQHATLQPSFEEPELDAFSRLRNYTTYTPFGSDSHEPSVPTGSSDSGHSGKPAQKIDDGLTMVDSLRKEGKLPTSSAAPSEDMRMEDSPKDKLRYAMRGLSAMTTNLPSLQKKTASRKPTSKSSNKLKMSALDLEGDIDVKDAAVDPFDTGNIPFSSRPSQAAPGVTKKPTAKREASAKASKTKKKTAAPRQKKAKESFITSMSGNSGDVNTDNGNDGGEECVEKVPPTRTTRNTGEKRKAKKPAAHKSQNGRNTEPKADLVLNDGNTSKTRSKTKSRAPMGKAAKTVLGKSSAANSSESTAKLQPGQIEPPATTTCKRAEQAATAQQPAIVRQDLSVGASTEMTSPIKAPATRSRQAKKMKTPRLIDSTANQDEGQHIDAGLKKARKAAIIPFGADAPQTNGRRRKNRKIADEAAENEDSGVHLEPELAAAAESKIEAASHRGNVHGLAEKSSQKQAEAEAQPALATKTCATLDAQTQSSEEESLSQEAVDSADGAQDLLKPSVTPDVDEEENEVILEDSFHGEAGERGESGNEVDNVVLGDESLTSLHQGSTIDAVEQGLTSYALSTSEESEKPSVANGQEAKQATEKKPPIQQASVEQEFQYGPSDDSDKLSTGNSRTKAHTHASKDVSTKSCIIQSTKNNVRIGQVNKTGTVHEPWDQKYTRRHRNLKRQASSDKTEQATYPVKQRLQLPGYYQSVCSVGTRQMDAEDVRSAPLAERVSERPVSKAVAHIADTLLPSLSSEETFCMPANGRSSDDIFGPGQPAEQIDINPAVLERLRGRAAAKRNMESRTAGPTSSVQRHTAAPGAGHPTNGTSPDQSIDEDVLRAAGMSGLRRQRATVNDFSQRKGTERVLERAPEQVEVEDRVGDSMHQIVNVSRSIQLLILRPCLCVERVSCTI